MPQDSIHGAEVSQDAELKSQAEVDAKELADPIKALKSIFKQKPRKRRAPLGLGPSARGRTPGRLEMTH